MMLPALACCECGREFLLPYRRLVQSAVVDPYWPEDQEKLPWVCDRCGRYNVFTFAEIQMRPFALPSIEERGFWRIEIACSDPVCLATVIAFTQTFGRTSRRALGLMIARAHPTPCCGLGHAIRIEHCYPLYLDFVEWNGPVEHVV